MEKQFFVIGNIDERIAIVAQPIGIEEQIKDNYNTGDFVVLEHLPDNWAQMTVVDGELLPASADVIVERAAAKLKQADKEEMAQIEQFLQNTDWMVVKCVEKNLSVEQVYPTILALRNEKRERLSILKERYQ